MQYAQIQVLPPAPPGGVTAGIGWAAADHVACAVDPAGRVLGRISAAHDRSGIRELVSALRAAGAAEVAIERGEGVLAGALLAAGLTVVVITSRRVKNLRSRYGPAGAKDDRFGAFVLADVLRTDRARLRPLVPGSPAALALRSAARARRGLVARRVAASSQLRARLDASFPAGTRLFAELGSRISLAFLTRFGSQDAAGALGEGGLAARLETLPHRGKAAGPEQLPARLPAEIGDCRPRFPDPESLQGLAGAAPVTRQPGKHASAGSRRAVNKQPRDAVRDFAGGSRHAGPWAAGIYGDARARGKDHPRAARITARAWLYVIWRCWQDGTACDPAKHRALQEVLDRQDSARETGSGQRPPPSPPRCAPAQPASAAAKPAPSCSPGTGLSSAVMTSAPSPAREPASPTARPRWPASTGRPRSQP